MNDNQPTNEIDRRTALSLLAGATAGGLILSDSSARAAETLPENDEIPQPGKFPRKPGNYLAGELVTVDAFNRRGGLRLDGDFNDDRYDKSPAARLCHVALWHDLLPRCSSGAA